MEGRKFPRQKGMSFHVTTAHRSGHLYFTSAERIIPTLSTKAGRIPRQCCHFPQPCPVPRTPGCAWDRFHSCDQVTLQGSADSPEGGSSSGPDLIWCQRRGGQKFEARGRFEALLLGVERAGRDHMWRERGSPLEPRTAPG